MGEAAAVMVAAAATEESKTLPKPRICGKLYLFIFFVIIQYIDLHFFSLQHKARVDAMMCDLASLRSVREFADSFKSRNL